MKKKWKRRYLLSIMTVLSLFCCACNDESNTNDEIDYSIFYEKQTTSDSIVEDQDITEEAEIDKQGVLAEKAGQPEEITPTVEGEKQEENTVVGDWPEEMNFQGVTTGVEEYQRGNISCNFKISGSASCLVCLDEMNSCMYYVNWMKDYYIYQVKEERSTLLVDMKANNLQLWNQKIYFIQLTDPIQTEFESNYGNLYCYDLNSKELQLVLEKNVSAFFIDNYGIYYQEYVEGEYSVHQLDFNYIDIPLSDTPLQDTPWILTYYEYLLYVSDGMLYLFNRETKEEISVMSWEESENTRNALTVFEDDFIFAKDSIIYLLNLSTGDRVCYDTMDCNGIFPIKVNIYSTVIINHEIYLSCEGPFIVRINLDGGEKSLLSPAYDESESHNFSMKFRFFQTDGESLYAIEHEKLTERFLELMIPSQQTCTYEDIPGYGVDAKEMGK